MRLNDTEIEQHLKDGIIGVEPAPQANNISGVTLDIHLGNDFRVLQDHAAPFIDISGSREAIEAAIQEVMSDEIVLKDDQAFLFTRANLL